MKWIPEDEYGRFEQLDDHLKLTAFLIQERIKGDQSEWKEWLGVGLLFKWD